MAEGELHIFADQAALARGVAEHIADRAVAAIAARGRFTLALAGGSTPRPAYPRLAQPAFAQRIAWAHVHLFWGDERCVPPHHPDSNYRMAHEALLAHVPIPPANIHRMRGELPPEIAATAYAASLREVFEETSLPRFDLILLGLGEDGHTASLFPGGDALHEQTRWVVAHYVEKLAAWQLTLTPPVINAAAGICFVVAGADKAARLHEVRHGPYAQTHLPAQQDGSIGWLIAPQPENDLPQKRRGPDWQSGPRFDVKIRATQRSRDAL